MIALFIVSLALVGLAESANDIRQSPCFKNFNAKKGIHDVIQECADSLITYGPTESLCGVSSAGKQCIKRQVDVICGPSFAAYFNGIWESLGLNGCIGQESVFASEDNIWTSPCSRNFNFHKGVSEVIQECAGSLITYGPSEPFCGLSIEGKQCIKRQVKDKCGPSFATFVNKIWDSLGLDGCLVSEDGFVLANGIWQSSCVRNPNVQKGIIEVIKECTDSILNYGPSEPTCGLSIEGRQCIKRQIKDMCGTSFGTLFNRIWDSLGLDGCLVKESILDGFIHGNSGEIDLSSLMKFGEQA